MASNRNNRGGIIIGPILVVGAIIALWKNEGRFDYYKAAKKATVLVDSSKHNSRSPIAFTGELGSFEIAGRYIEAIPGYFQIRVGDLLSKSRSRSITRPRQIAMSLAKELTSHSLPEIGDAFGGRDHTTVLHACRKIKELRETENRVREDYQNLLRTLSG